MGDAKPPTSYPNPAPPSRHYKPRAACTVPLAPCRLVLVARHKPRIAHRLALVACLVACPQSRAPRRVPLVTCPRRWHKVLVTSRSARHTAYRHTAYVARRSALAACPVSRASVARRLRSLRAPCRVPRVACRSALGACCA